MGYIKNYLIALRLGYEKPTAFALCASALDLFTFVRLTLLKFKIAISTKSYGSLSELPASCKITSMPSVASPYRESKPGFFLGSQILTNRGITTSSVSQNSDPENASATPAEVTPRIKFKRLDKTARHIMQAGLYSYLLLFERRFCNPY
ncbi:hypothetical protein Hanom_Chr12g01165901 [Helianthus anomalus]